MCCVRSVVPRLVHDCVLSTVADSVEDVSFATPIGSSADVFASVGDDLLLLVWDARAGTAPVLKVRVRVLAVITAECADVLLCCQCVPLLFSSGPCGVDRRHPSQRFTLRRLEFAGCLQRPDGF